MKSLLIATLSSLSCLAALAAPITLTGTVRDFNADGVNFEGSGGSGTGYVNTTLLVMSQVQLQQTQ